jgi:organic radical activating enzyme
MMMELSDNLYNAGQARHAPKLKLWRYAGLLLTYRCTAACRFCYYRCSPSAGGLMSVDTALESWQGLERISGSAARVHLTGGEPFLCFDRLAEICTEARRLGLTGAESVETNGSWVADESDSTVRDKLKLLEDRGVERLKISWDPFHEEFVRIEHVRRLIDLAGQVYGPERVLVRWQKYLESPSGVMDLPEEVKKAVFKQALSNDSCRYTGRAAEALSGLAAGQSPAAFEGRHCRSSVLEARGVHIDPDGNVFVGQCSGMVLGNINRTKLDLLWRTFEPNKTDFWSVLYEDGPWGFLEEAVAAGYAVCDNYASKCHLCTDVRGFFFDKKRYSSIIGPEICYPRF